jgi:3alpha(or 20beta)-hydroxysteroid dehydrogenase
MERLAKKVALVSGGARGLGAAHARAIVAEGGKVVIGDVLDVEGRALAAELGDAARYVHLDVTSCEEWATAVAVAVDTFGLLNVLVNNAGIWNHGAIGEYTIEQWDRIMSINVTGAFLGITAARDALVASAPSSIVNTSSTAGIQGNPFVHGYVASKFAIRGLTKSVALELGPLNVRVNSVHPGVIRTPMTDGLEVGGQIGALRRIGEPEEVAALVVFLASDESSFQTGAEFIVDGGQLAGESQSVID